MPLFADAWASLKRNQFELLIYVVGLSLFILLTSALSVALGITPDSEASWLPIFRFSLTLVQAAFQSAIMAIVFARMGEDIDRPLWRCPSGAEALQRFFMPWFILNLGMLTLLRISERAAEADYQGAAYTLVLLFLLGWVVALPAGACVMYHGRLHWPELGIALRPIVGRFDLSFLVFSVLLLQFLLMLAAQSFAVSHTKVDNDDLWQVVKTQILYWPLAAIPLNLLDLYAFAMMWRVCMIFRDEETDEEDPFDF